MAEYCGTFEIEPDEEIPPILYTPNVIDLEVTPRCEFSCPDCWGTKPYQCPEKLNHYQQLEIFERLRGIPDDFVARVVLSGGEALLEPYLVDLVDGLVDMKHEVSLSTTGLDRYKQLARILGQLSAIGIPIDGPNAAVNSTWRNHPRLNDGGLRIATDALRLVQSTHPELKTSVRTLVNPGNVDYIQQIPHYLELSGIDISRLRWVLYEQVIRRPGLYGDSVLVSSRSIEGAKVGAKYFQESVEYAGRKFNEVVIRTIGSLAGRNFIISPSGECRAVMPGSSKNEVVERGFGNIYHDFDDVIELLNEDTGAIGTYSVEASAGPAYYYYLSDKGYNL